MESRSKITELSATCKSVEEKPEKRSSDRSHPCCSRTSYSGIHATIIQQKAMVAFNEAADGWTKIVMNETSDRRL